MIKSRKKSNSKKWSLVLLTGLLVILALGSFSSLAKAADDGLFPAVTYDPTDPTTFATDQTSNPAASAQPATTPATAAGTNTTMAPPGPWTTLIANALGGFAGWCVWFEGGVIALETKILISIMSYNDFVVSDAVKNGWTLVRDIANLFFIVILLVIAIATILRVESYNLKKLLPKVLIMAVLVNFSRTICGLAIDAAQVVMMTFVSAFAGQAGESGLIGALNVQGMLSASSAAGNGAPITLLIVTASGALAVIMMLIAIVVLLVMLVVILMRIIMLWLLVVLSPLAYILSAFPQGQRYAQQWWQEFSKYVIIGPILAFFMWLTFSIAGPEGKIPETQLGSQASAGLSSAGLYGAIGTYTLGSADASASSNFFTKIGDTSGMISFIIAIGMLMGGLMITQQMGVAGGSFAGTMSNKIRSAGLAPLRGAGKLASLGWQGTKAVGKAPFQYGARKLNEAIGEGRISPIWNPAGMVRGWNERRKELYDTSKAKATAGGQEVWEKLFTGTSMPRRDQLAIAEEAKFAKDFGYMDKEEMAKTAVRLGNSGNSAENRAKRRALITAAAENGYLDDLMAHPETRKRVKKRVEETYAKGTAEQRAEMDKIDEETGLSLMDRVKQDKGQWYDWDTLHVFLKDYIGGSQEGLTTIANLEDMARKVNHPEYAGHATFRSSEDGGKDEMEMETMYDQKDASGTVVRKSGRKRMLTEFSKWPGRNKMSTAPHGFLYYNEDGSYGMNETGRLAATVAFGGQGARIVEHSQDRIWKMLQGGSGDSMNWKEGSEGAIANFDKKDGTPANAIHHAQALAYMLNTAADANNSPEKLAKLVWKKSGGESEQAQYQVNGRTYDVKDFLDEFGPRSVTGHVTAEAGEPTPAPGPMPSAPRMAESFDMAKHDRTHELVEKYQATGFNFYRDSDDYQKNPELYEAQADYQRHSAALNQTELDKIRGVKTAATQKSGAEQAGVGINFNDPEIRKAYGVRVDQDAAYFEGDSKEKAIKALVDQYAAQLTQGGAGADETAELVRKFEQGLHNAETLRLHNNASLSSRLDQARHERAHGRTTGLDEKQLDQFWSSLDQEQQQSITADITSRYGNLSNKQLRQEAIAEMMGVGKGAYQLGDKTKQVLEGLPVWGGEKNKTKTIAAIDNLGEANSNLYQAQNNRKDAEQELKAKGQKKTELHHQLNLAGEDKDQLFVDKLKKSIKEVDDEIDMLEGKVRKAKSLEHKAINGIMAAHDNLDELTGVATSRRAGSKTVEGSVKSQLGARETLRQAVAAPNEEVRRRIVERIEPREAIAAGQEEVEEQGKKVQTAMQNLDNSEIVNALTGVERTLTAIQAALEKLPAGQTESAAKSDLANAIEQLQGYRTTVRGGGNLDPQSTNGLLFNINQNLKNLNRRTGKPTGRVPKDINPA